MPLPHAAALTSDLRDVDCKSGDKVNHELAFPKYGITIHHRNGGFVGLFPIDRQARTDSIYPL